MSGNSQRCTAHHGKHPSIECRLHPLWCHKHVGVALLVGCSLLHTTLPCEPVAGQLPGIAAWHCCLALMSVLGLVLGVFAGLDRTRA